jgi:hypothetical protein
MIFRKIFFTFILCSVLSCATPAQEISPSNLKTALPPTSTHIPDFSEVVIPITDLRPSFGFRLFPRPAPTLGVKAGFATGFCVDPACRFIGTNYHVAALASPRKIKGDRVVARYLATDPKDDGATSHMVSRAGPLFYAANRDLAIFELRKPLRHHHGLAFSLDDLEIGQAVDIYAYPLEGINPFRKLRRFPATFQGESTSGLLLFAYTLEGGKRIVGGASGGIVVDRNTCQIVGILSGVADSVNPTAEAVPIQSLVGFLSRVQPFLAKELFPASKEVPVSPASGDLYPEFVPPHAPVLQHRAEEPSEVTLLRRKAQLLADSMRNFIAVQSLSWGWDHNGPVFEAQYEVRIIDGEQRFREYPDGDKELKTVPIVHLKGSAYPLDEWSELPNMVGTEYGLKIHQAPDVLVDGRRTKVFQFYASSEDNVCTFQPYDDYLFFIIRARITSPPCYGEVWTDEDMNLIRISERLDLSAKLRAYRGWKNYQVILTYGSLKRANQPPQLVPWTAFIQAQNGRHVYWNRSFCSEYKEFTAHARLLTN